IGVLWFGAGRINSGHMAIGSLIAFLSYVTQILFAVMMATFMVVMLPRAAVSGARIQDVLDTDTSVVAPDEPVTETDGRGTLEFRNVEFGYPGAEEPVLNGISVTARPGEI